MNGWWIKRVKHRKEEEGGVEGQGEVSVVGRGSGVE